MESSSLQSLARWLLARRPSGFVSCCLLAINALLYGNIHRVLFDVRNTLSSELHVDDNAILVQPSQLVSKAELSPFDQNIMTSYHRQEEQPLHSSTSSRCFMSESEIRPIRERLLGYKKKSNQSDDNTAIIEDEEWELETEFAKKQGKQIPLDQAILLHIGKAGGGTVRTTLKFKWGYALKECHQTAQRCFGSRKGFPNSSVWNHGLVFVTIRDPIERFISAFNWHVGTECRDDKETESRTVADPPILAVRHPDQYCRRRQAWHINSPNSPTGPKFQGIVDKMASDLCTTTTTDDGERLVVDETSNAYSAMTKSINHLKNCTISSFLGETDNYSEVYNWKDNTRRLVPVVMEPGWDLEEITHETIFSISNIEKEVVASNIFRDDPDFTNRSQLAMCRAPTTSSSQTSHSNNTTGAVNFVHSSSFSSSSNGRNNNEKKYLSKRSQQCLAKYYQRDYEILQELLDWNACKTEQCVLAIQSILNRRKDLLSF